MLHTGNNMFSTNMRCVYPCLHFAFLTPRSFTGTHPLLPLLQHNKWWNCNVLPWELLFNPTDRFQQASQLRPAPVWGHEPHMSQNNSQSYSPSYMDGLMCDAMHSANACHVCEMEPPLLWLSICLRNGLTTDNGIFFFVLRLHRRGWTEWDSWGELKRFRNKEITN